jgi:hypothetical protein
MLDLKKISNIDNKQELKKYKINEPIFLNNYLFHYLILTNNIKALQLTNYPVYRFNDENLNGFMLASKIDNYKILNYLVKNYEKYIYNKNSDNENFLHYLDPEHKEYLTFIEKNKLDWLYLYHTYSTDKISPLDNLFLFGSYKYIKKIIKMINFEYDKFENQPSYFNLLNNEKLTENNILNIYIYIYNQNKNIFNYLDLNGDNLLHFIVIKNKLQILKYFSEKNINLDIYSPINTNHLFITAYNNDVFNDNYNMSKYILDKIIDNHNFNEIDIDGNNLAQFILKNRIKYNRGNYDIESKILEKNNIWTRPNLNKLSTLDYITQLDYNKYHSFLKNRKINKEYNYKKIKNKSWYNLVKGLKKCDVDENIILDEYKYKHSNEFQARFTDIAIFMYQLDKKYKNLYLPKYKNDLDINIYNNTLIYPDTLLKQYNNFAWLIIWNDINNYFIHPYLNDLINKNKDKYDYGVCMLSLRLPNDGLHASIILYDFKNKIIERFEPYGNTNYLDKDIDIVLSKELLKDNTTEHNFKYYEPSKYFPVAGFQTLSDENNMFNQKMGDFGGYCLAWCLWYIEHRIKNKDIEPKILISKTINKFLKMDIKPNEYIRNYANHINKLRVKWLKNIGINENLISNEILPPNIIKKIKLNIIKQNNK